MMNLAKLTHLISTIYNDAAQPWQLGFQDSAAPGFTGIVTLHNTIGFYLIVISLAVFWVLFSIVYYFDSSKNAIAHKYLTHGTVLELVWTITPALILIAIAFPSFRCAPCDTSTERGTSKHHGVGCLSTECLPPSNAYGVPNKAPAGIAVTESPKGTGLPQNNLRISGENKTRITNSIYTLTGH